MRKRLVGYLAMHRARMLALLVAMLATTGVELLAPWPLKLVVDNVVDQRPLLGRSLSEGERHLLLALAALGFVVLAALRGVLDLLRRRWLTEVSQGASLAMRSDLYAQVQRLSLRFYDRARIGDMVTRITADVDKLQEAFVNAVSMVFVELLTVVGIAVIMFLVDWQFALVSLLVLLPLYLIYTAFKRRIKAASREVRAGEGAMSSIAQEALASIRVVKAFGQEERERERFLDQTRFKVAASIEAATWEGKLSLWVEVVTAAGISLVLGFGGWRVMRGDMTLGQMLLFMQYLTTMYTPLRRLSRLTGTVQKASASAERIQELFVVTPEVPEAAHPVPIDRARGEITFEGVWFEYEADRPVLRGIDLHIEPGEVVALVGQTGAGKSTLASLIPRFYDPTRGRILLDGRDLRELRLADVRDQCSIVLQDPVLFSGSVRDNIAYGRPEATDEAVLAAARAANAHQFISELPDGYGTMVGERGATLSGGQRQRIAIARALLKDAPILLLDEPTSSLDAASERLIRDALATLVRHRAVLIIAHRPSAIELADRVVVLEEGTVIEQGALSELHRSGEVFRRLYVEPSASLDRA